MSNPTNYGYEFTKIKKGDNIKNTMDVQFYKYDDDWVIKDQTFKILTWNIWGVEHFKHYSLLDERLPHINNTIKHHQPEFICLQEVSQTVIDTWIKKEDWIKNNYYISSIKAPWVSPEIDIQNSPYTYNEPNVWCYMISKYRPIASKIYVLDADLVHFSSMAVNFGFVVIVVVHLQSGGTSSGFPKEIGLKYHECRKNQIKVLKEQIYEDFKGSNFIFAGDYNCDLDGDLSEWPEVDEIKHELIDVWDVLNKDGHRATEDTYRNTMRYNIKHTHKKYRYDGILYKGNDIQPQDITMIGDDPIFQITHNKFKKLTGKNAEIYSYKNNNKYIDWYSSDHFGLVSTFKTKHIIPEIPFINN